MKYPCRITCNEIPDVSYYLQSNTQPYLQFYNHSFMLYYLQCNTILNVSYLSPTAALLWFRMFICFFVEMFIQDYAWLRCWQGYTVHERWLGLVEGVDLENVLLSVLKLTNFACGSPWTQAISWWRSKVSWPVALPGHRPSPDDGVMSLGLWLSLDTGRLLMTE